MQNLVLYELAKFRRVAKVQPAFMREGKSSLHICRKYWHEFSLNSTNETFRLGNDDQFSSSFTLLSGKRARRVVFPVKSVCNLALLARDSISLLRINSAKQTEASAPQLLHTLQLDVSIHLRE